MRVRFTAQRSVLLAGSLALASVLFLVGESPVAADQYTGDLCLYEDRDFNYVWPFNGDVQCFNGGTSGNVSASMNDQTTSVDNRGFGSHRMCLYEHANQVGNWIALDAGGYYKNLSWNTHPTGNWNDKISSVGPC